MFIIAEHWTGLNILLPLPSCYNHFSPLQTIFSLSTALRGVLGCEQLFYFCFPLIIPFISNKRYLLITLLVCLVIMLAGMALTPEEQIKAYWYVNPITRLPDFLAGVLLYQFYQSLSHRNISYSTGTILETGAVILFLLFYLGAADIPKVYRYSCYYWLPVSVLILIFALQKGGISRLLSNRFLIIGGEISYSFYLIHLFIILTYSKWLLSISGRLNG